MSSILKLERFKKANENMSIGEVIDSYIEEIKETHKKELGQFIFEVDRLKKELVAEKEEHKKTLDENVELKSKVVALTETNKMCESRYKELQEKLQCAISEKEKWRNRYNTEVKGYNH